MTERIPVASLVVLSFVLFVAGFVIGLFAIAAVPVSASVANSGFIGFATGVVTGIAFISLIFLRGWQAMTRKGFLFMLAVGNILVAATLIIADVEIPWLVDGTRVASPLLASMALFTSILAAAYAARNCERK